jgi:hypothetical protein
MARSRHPTRREKQPLQQAAVSTKALRRCLTLPAMLRTKWRHIAPVLGCPHRWAMKLQASLKAPSPHPTTPPHARVGASLQALACVDFASPAPVQQHPSSGCCWPGCVPWHRWPGRRRLMRGSTPADQVAPQAAPELAKQARWDFWRERSGPPGSPRLGNPSQPALDRARACQDTAWAGRLPLPLLLLLHRQVAQQQKRQRQPAGRRCTRQATGFARKRRHASQPRPMLPAAAAA